MGKGSVEQGGTHRWMGRRRWRSEPLLRRFLEMSSSMETDSSSRRRCRRSNWRAVSSSSASSTRSSNGSGDASATWSSTFCASRAVSRSRLRAADLRQVSFPALEGPISISGPSASVNRGVFRSQAAKGHI